MMLKVKDSGYIFILCKDNILYFITFINELNFVA